LDDYVSRMKDEQKEIYYLYAPNRETLEAGPHLEAFKALGLEVFYLYEPVDEFVMTSLGRYGEKDLISADNAEIKLDEISGESKEDALPEEDAKALCEWIKETLGERVNDVGVSKRLTDSPVVALNADKHMTPSMRRMMKALKQDVDLTQSINLEINTAHKLITSLAALKDKDPETAKLVTEQMFDNALIAAGFLEDPRTMVSRIYKILERVAAS
jgi:TNF receptor-associated protein 1